MDAVAGFPPHKVINDVADVSRWLKVFDKRFVGMVMWYDDVVKALQNRPADFRLLPGVLPHWDNDARRPNQSVSIAGSTPEKYREWLLAAGRQASENDNRDERIVFINAWNEWAEGAYLEPDRHYGASYLVATSQALERLSQLRDTPAFNSERSYSELDVPFRSPANVLRSLPRRALRRAAQRFPALVGND